MRSSSDEQVLNGGNINSVVRVGDTVRRLTGLHSRTIHDYLLHLEQKNVPAPRFLGIDDSKREVLSFIHGDTEYSDDIWKGETALIKAARMLRQLHDASLDFVAPEPASWVYCHPDPEQREVICHNDFAPYNMIFHNGVPKAIVDFDLCGPGPRTRDLAYLAYWMTPLSFADDDLRGFSESDANAGSHRLRLLCRSYGGQPPQEVLPMVSEVLHHMSDEEAVEKMVGTEAVVRLKADGHLDHWSREARAFDGMFERLMANVS